MKNGIALITEERERGISQEGFDAAHDDTHVNGQLAQAAASYAIAAALESEHGKLPPCFIPRQWPWERAWWKPRDRIKNLARAGALIAAEIDRLQRLDGPVQR